MKEFIDKEGRVMRLLALEELRPTDEGQTNVLLQTMVTGVSEVEHFSIMLVSKCTECSEESHWEWESVEQDWRNQFIQTKCDRCNKAMVLIQNTKSQLRKVLLTEQGQTNPIHLQGFIYGNDINKIIPGTKLNMSGVLRSRKNSPKDLTYKRLFDISRFTLTDDKPMLPTIEEIEFFKNMDKGDLVKSFAPHIRNMYLMKEAILLCCLGGVEKKDSRGDINMIMLGDPGVAKTQLLKFATKIVQKSDYVSGKSASGAGLFGGVDNLSDGTRIGKPGSVVLCNGGIACIDEIEKMNPSDRTYAHEVMESQTFSLRKIGIDITWQVKVSIIAAGNPKKSRWNPELSIKENVNIPDSLMSRFGLIFLIRDLPNRDEDLAIAQHIAKVRQGTVEAPISVEMITKFINYAKTFNPVESDETGALLTDWWSRLREETQKEESISVDIRTLEDLHRITEAYARMDLSEIATVEHAKKAIKMLNDSLHTLGMNTPGEKNASITEHLSKDDYVRFVFTHPVTHGMAIAKLMEKQKWFPTQAKAEGEIQKLVNMACISEQGGEYIWV